MEVDDHNKSDDMDGKQKNLKKYKVKTIFNNMDLRFADDDYNALAMDWVMKNQELIYNIVKYSNKKPVLNVGSKLTFENNSSINYNNYRQSYQWYIQNCFQRYNVFFRLASLIEENKLLFAQLDAMERNVPVQNIIDCDIQYFIDYFKTVSILSLEDSKNFVKKNKSFEEIFKEGNNPDSTPQIKITGDLPFFEICWNICPRIICGQKIDLTVDFKASLVLILFIKLCQEAGMPEDVLRIIKIASLDKNLESQCLNKNEMMQKGVAIVLESVDLNSAVDGILDGSCCHNGSVPWSIKRVLVQESSYDDFKRILLERTNLFHVNLEGKIKDIVERVESTGFSVVKMNKLEQEFKTPNIVLGCPEFLFYSDLDFPIITIEPFRTINESIKLVNDFPFFIYASVWTNSYSAMQKVSSLLIENSNIQTVWKNVHGLLRPTVPFVADNIPHTPKYDLFNVLFQECFPKVFIKYNPFVADIKRLTPTYLFDKTLCIDDVLNNSRKAFKIWNNVNISQRVTLLYALAEKISNEKDYLKRYLELQDGNESSNSFIKFLIDTASLILNSVCNSHINSTAEIRNVCYGVVLLELPLLENSYNTLIIAKLLISFIINGNSLIIFAKYGSDKIKKLYNMLNDILKDELPKHLITVFGSEFPANLITFEITENLNSEIVAVKTYLPKAILSI